MGMYTKIRKRASRPEAIVLRKAEHTGDYQVVIEWTISRDGIETAVYATMQPPPPSMTKAGLVNRSGESPGLGHRSVKDNRGERSEEIHSYMLNWDGAVRCYCVRLSLSFDTLK